MENGVTYAKLDPDGIDRFQRLRDQLGVTSFGMSPILMDAGVASSVEASDRIVEALPSADTGSPRERN